MPFEVKAIKGPETIHTGQGYNPEAVAAQIKDFYTHAAEKGGSVIAGYTLLKENDNPGSRGVLDTAEVEYLFLVATFPAEGPTF